MPKSLDGKKLSKAEHKQWKAVYAKTGSAAAATGAIKRRRRGRK